MSTLVRGPYLWRALHYARRQAQIGAFDEHLLFDAANFSSSATSRAWPQALVGLSLDWQERLSTTRTRQFVVVRDGIVTRRWLAPGTEADRPGRLYSITKSVLSLAWGIAHDQGLLPGLDEVVYRGMTVRQLLRMDSGLAFDEGFARLNHQTKTYLHPRARSIAAEVGLKDPVGSDFHYNDYHSLILGTLLESALASRFWQPQVPSASLVASWIYENLLAPLGLQAPARWVIDSGRQGFAKTESGLCLCADDVARVGQLVLNGGIWEGRRLVSPSWLEQSTGRNQAWQGTQPFHRYRNLSWGPWLEQGRGFYGLHWWGRREDSGPDTVFALGIHGQVLLISPRHRAVVVRLADRWALKDWWPDAILDALEQGDL